jgi:hypothetical protein
MIKVKETNLEKRLIDYTLVTDTTQKSDGQ